MSSEGWHENKNEYIPFIKYMFGIVVASYREFSSRVKLIKTAGLTKGDSIGKKLSRPLVLLQNQRL